jgi:hypothetical protein
LSFWETESSFLERRPGNGSAPDLLAIAHQNRKREFLPNQDVRREKGKYLLVWKRLAERRRESGGQSFLPSGVAWGNGIGSYFPALAGTSLNSCSGFEHPHYREKLSILVIVAHGVLAGFNLP